MKNRGEKEERQDNGSCSPSFQQVKKNIASYVLFSCYFR